MTTPRDTYQPRMKGVLVGCGYISTRQLQAWHQVHNAEIVAVVDVDRSKAEAQAEAFEIPEVHNDLAAALASGPVDFVDIATPPLSHLDLVRAAVEGGANVLCQKPPASTLTELREMISIADNAGLKFVVNENMRFQPWFRATKLLVEDGVIGRPFYARFLFRSRASLPVPSFGPQPYFADMPRLIVYEMGIHVFDTARYLFGEPAWLVARTGKASEEIASEDHAVVLLTFEDLTVVIDGSWASIPIWETDTRVSWTDLVIEGTGGTLHLGIDGHLRLITDSGKQTVAGYGPDGVQLGFVGMQQHFVDCLLGRASPETGGLEYLKTMELVFGTYDAGERQDVYHVGTDLTQLL